MNRLKYPYVFCDIDDTLLDNERKISADNKYVIEEYTKMHGNLILVTGRNFTAAEAIYKSLHLNTPIVINQGSVYLPHDNIFLYQNFLKVDKLIALCLHLEKLNIYFQIFCGDKIYVQHKTHYSYTYIKNCGVTIIETNVALSEFLSVHKTPVDKLMVECDVSIVDNLALLLKKSFGECFAIEKSKSWIIEVSSLESTKGNAIKYIQQMYGIHKNQCMAIGDSQNDITMFETVGFSVAVANSSLYVSSKADAISSSNNNSGVAAAIQKYAYADLP